MMVVSDGGGSLVRVKSKFQTPKPQGAKAEGCRVLVFSAVFKAAPMLHTTAARLLGCFWVADAGRMLIDLPEMRCSVVALQCLQCCVLQILRS